MSRLLIALAATSGLASGALAQEYPGADPAPNAAADAPAKEELTAEEKAEREGRKACKVAICAAFHRRDPAGGDIACSVLKSWRKEQLTKMVSKAKVSWPWGKVVCSADIKLKREALIKAMTESKYETTLERHQVTCEVEREKDGPAKLAFDFVPKIKFENGKAVKASLNWGKVEAPTLVKGAVWTATATDNTFNVLESTLIEDINDFVSKKCDEVKSEWAGK
ncbi:MAG: hypothetical protein AB1749_05310 [Pseudomonadota bacterium]